MSVNHFGGSGSVDYSVAIYLDDIQYSNTFTGTLTSSGETANIATFTYPQ